MAGEQETVNDTVVVAREDDLRPGERIIVDVDGRSIGIYNLNGALFAIRNFCPHMGAPLCEGTVSGSFAASRPQEYVYERQGEVLYCPWHHWSFDIATGASLVDRKLKVRTYPVEAVDGEIRLRLRR